MKISTYLQKAIDTYKYYAFRFLLWRTPADKAGLVKILEAKLKAKDVRIRRLAVKKLAFIPIVLESWFLGA
jgi:hypothetical protein